MSTPDDPVPAGEATDTFGRVEARGIDYVPPSERHGKAGNLFPVWISANVAYLYIVLGGAMLLFGLSLWESLAVVVVGNLYWLGVGWLSVSGPASGTPAVVVMRSMFGIRGNRLFSAGLNWLIAVSYEAINLCFGSLAVVALADFAGWSPSTPAKLAIVAAVAVVTFTISIYGHATIVRLSVAFTVVLAVCTLVLGVFVVRRADFSFQPQHPLTGSALVSALFVGFAIIASQPMSWLTGADYSRYLPERTSRRAVVGWVALGGFLPAVLLGFIGVAAGTVIDMNDPQTTFREILPPWFYAVFLLVVVLGTMTNNVLTAYSSGLFLQGLGVKLRRSQSVLIDAVIGGCVTIYALFVATNFIATLSKWLELSVVILGPLMAVYAIDIVLTRNRYDGVALNDETSASAFWFNGGIRYAGAAAVVMGAAAAGLSMHTLDFQGPVAKALDGADLSVVLGPVVAALIYGVLARRSARHTMVERSIRQPIAERS